MSSTPPSRFRRGLRAGVIFSAPLALSGGVAAARTATGSFGHAQPEECPTELTEAALTFLQSTPR
jgi:hypothetical protein